MTYKLITREDFDRASTFGILPKLIDRLFSERDDALKMCAAYREVAIKSHIDLVRESEDVGIPTEKWVDAEAARIMEQKK